MRFLPHVILTLTLFLSSAAAAQSRMMVAPFSGPKATVARGQLLKAVCEEVECVPVTKGTTRGKVDWKKVKRQKVEAVLTGRVVKRRIHISLIKKARGRPVWKKAYPVKAGKLSAASVKDITRRVSDALGGGRAPAEAEEEEEEMPVAAAPAPVAAADAEEEEEASDSESSPADAAASALGFGQLADPSSPSESAARDPVELADASSTREREASDSDSDAELRSSSEDEASPGPTTPLISAQVGLDMLNRSYAVGGLQTGNLRDYSAPLIVAPRIRVEVNPMARGGGALAGLGLEADFALSLALKSGVAGAQTFPTSMTRIDFGALYAFRPFSSNFAIVPHLGYRKHSFQVNAASDGTQLDGLPPISYGGIRAALGVDAPLSSRFLLSGFLGFMPSLSTGAIGADPFFPGSKANGLEVGAGAGYLLSERIELRVSAQLTRYSISLKPAPGGAFVASSASDQYLGGMLGARYRY